jgi:hypothetical protein
MNLEELEKRLIKVEKELKITKDLEEIRNLHYRYVNCITEAKWDEIMENFAENSTLDVFGDNEVAKGKPAIEDTFRKVLSIGHVGKEGNFAVHPIITVDGDKARGKWLFYMMFAHPNTWQSLFWVQGYVNTEYVRENGEWKILSLKFRMRLSPKHDPVRGNIPPWVT